MSKINEELVQEILRLHCDGCDFYDSGDGCMEPELSEKAYCIPRAKKAIMLILSAVRNGDLDEALGVVGRDKVEASDDYGLLTVNDLHGELEIGDTIIAFRQEEEK